MKICVLCQETIPYDELKKAFVFTPGKMINGIFFGEEESYYYHKDCIDNEEILLYP